MTESPSASTDALDRGADVAEMVAGADLLDPGEERCPGSRRADAWPAVSIGPIGKVIARVGDPAVLGHADVDREDVAALQLVGPGIPCTTIEFGEAQIEPGKPR